MRQFQARHGLEETGTIGPKTLAALNVPVDQRLRQLAASLDRLAAMDFHFGQRYVVVNLPAAFAEAVEGNKVVRRHVVQVGRPDRPSPTLTTNITTVNLNPTWTVPLGILKKDVIPKMRKDPGYAARMHMRVLDGAGREVDPYAVDWNSDRAPNFTIRQDSGAWNALGSRAHRHAEPAFGLHARHQPQGILQRRLPVPVLRLHPRRRSARRSPPGCWRTRPAGAAAQIDAAIAKGERLDVRLAHKVPVAWIYLTGWVTRDGDDPFPRRHLRPRRQAGARWSPTRVRRSRAPRAPPASCYSRPTPAPVQASVLSRQPVSPTVRA